jgi:hypothetical protein
VFTAYTTGDIHRGTKDESSTSKKKMSAKQLIEAGKVGMGVEVSVANLFCSHILRVTAYTVLGPRTQNKPHYDIRIERFIEDHAFLRSYDSAPRPPLPPSTSPNCLSFSVFLRVAGPVY